MKKLPIIIAIFLALVIGFTGGWRASQSSPPINDTVIFTDTVIDTIEYPLPVPVDSVVLRYVTVKLPVIDTASTKEAEDDTGEPDSAYVEIPIQQKEYQDSSYHAWVSGYNVSLDSLKVFRSTVTETQYIYTPPKRWGLGIQVGIGFTGKRIEPFVGIGVSCNLLTW